MGEPVLDAENAAPDLDVDAARDEAMRRLFTSDLRLEPSIREQAALNAITDAAVELGTQILLHAPHGRERSTALTHLEDALIRARRAIFERMLG